MKERKNISINYKILILIFLFLIILTAVYLVFIKKEQNPLTNLFTNNSKNEISDNYNGFYVYKESLNRSYTAYQGCSVKTLDTYIVVIDREYIIYRSTCMGTYLIKSGNTTELDFSFDKENNSYYIKYDDKNFSKDLTTRALNPNNNIASNLNKIDLDSYIFILKQTQFPGNYYNVDSEIYTNRKIKMRIIPDQLGGFDFTFYTNDKTGRILYTYSAPSLDKLPQINAYYDKLILIEKNINSYNLTSYNIKTISPTNQIDYSLDKMFPITVNNIKLTTDNSIFIKYNQANKYYDLLIGYNNNFCYESSDSEEIAYYHFKIEYDYKNLSLTKPTYIETIYRKDGCALYNKIVEE